MGSLGDGSAWPPGVSALLEKGLDRVMTGGDHLPDPPEGPYQEQASGSRIDTQGRPFWPQKDTPKDPRKAPGRGVSQDLPERGEPRGL